MRFSTLGHTGVEVSRVSLGTAFFGVHIKEEECARILDRALELGINVIDTAEKYIRPKPGTSESVLGDLLQGRREEVFLATKVDPGRAWAGGSLNRGLTRRVLVQAVEGSLRRLDTDHIDLLYAHEPDSSTPLDETIAAFDHLIQAGKVRYAASPISPRGSWSRRSGPATAWAVGPSRRRKICITFSSGVQNQTFTRSASVTASEPSRIRRWRAVSLLGSTRRKWRRAIRRFRNRFERAISNGLRKNRARRAPHPSSQEMPSHAPQGLLHGHETAGTQAPRRHWPGYLATPMSRRPS